MAWCPETPHAKLWHSWKMSTLAAMSCVAIFTGTADLGVGVNLMLAKNEKGQALAEFTLVLPPTTFSIRHCRI